MLVPLDAMPPAGEAPGGPTRIATKSSAGEASGYPRGSPCGAPPGAHCEFRATYRKPAHGSRWLRQAKGQETDASSGKLSRCFSSD